MNRHLPVKPDWDCSEGCGAWPCETARVELAAEMDSIQLAMYAWAQLEDAAKDLDGDTPAQLFARFIGWTRPGGDHLQPGHSTI